MTEKSNAALLERYRADVATLEQTGLEERRQALEEAKADLGRVSLAYPDENHEKVRDAAAAVTRAGERLVTAEQRLIVLRQEIGKLEALEAQQERDRVIRAEVLPPLIEANKQWDEAYRHAVGLGKALRKACDAQHSAFGKLPVPGDMGTGISTIFDPAMGGTAMADSAPLRQVRTSLEWALHFASEGLLPRPLTMISPPNRNLAQIEADWRPQRRDHARNFLRALGAVSDVLEMWDEAVKPAESAETATATESKTDTRVRFEDDPPKPMKLATAKAQRGAA